MPEYPSGSADGDQNLLSEEGPGGSSPLTSVAQLPARTDFDPSAALSPVPRTVHQLFSRQAALHPTGAALGAGTKVYTYAQLDRRTNQLARHLLSRGLRTEDRVALLTGRSPEMVVAALGALKAGAAYLPIDPRQPAARLRFMIEDAAARVVLTTRRLAHLLEGLGRDVEVVRLDDEAEERRLDTYSDDAADGGRRRQRGLRHLHVGLDGHAEGRRPDARRPAQPGRDPHGVRRAG